MSRYDRLQWIGSACGPLALGIVLAMGFGGGKGCHLPVPEPPASISLPAEVKVGVGELSDDLLAETKGKAVRWWSSDGLQAARTGERTVRVVARAPGRYVLLAWTSLEDGPTDAARCTVVVGASPTPPGPGPGPTPVPPGPGPAPPLSPFAQAIKAAYDADPSPTRAADKDILAAIYAQSAGLARDPAMATVGQLQKAMHNAAQYALGDRLKGVRQVIAAELVKTLPTQAETVLDARTRELMIAEFGRVQKALNEVK